jgi:hypothetical protein
LAAVTWNPAIISALEDQEFLLGTALALSSIHLQSSLAADSVGGVFPPTNRFGEARSNGGVSPALATGVSFRCGDDSPLTLGIGVFALASATVNFPGAGDVARPRTADTAALLRRRADLLEPRLALRKSDGLASAH